MLKIIELHSLKLNTNREICEINLEAFLENIFFGFSQIYQSRSIKINENKSKTTISEKFSFEILNPDQIIELIIEFKLKNGQKFEKNVYLFLSDLQKKKESLEIQIDEKTKLFLRYSINNKMETIKINEIQNLREKTEVDLDWSKIIQINRKFLSLLVFFTHIFIDLHEFITKLNLIRDFVILILTLLIINNYNTILISLAYFLFSGNSKFKIRRLILKTLQFYLSKPFKIEETKQTIQILVSFQPKLVRNFEKFKFLIMNQNKFGIFSYFGPFMAFVLLVLLVILNSQFSIIISSIAVYIYIQKYFDANFIFIFVKLKSHKLFYKVSNLIDWKISKSKVLKKTFFFYEFEESFENEDSILKREILFWGQFW